MIISLSGNWEAMIEYRVCVGRAAAKASSTKESNLNVVQLILMPFFHLIFFTLFLSYGVTSIHVLVRS